MEGANVGERIRETLDRLDIWWEAASGGGISTDLLPFLVMLLAMSWIVGFLGSWFIFRRNNVWFAVVFLGTAILTNLSFLPESFIPRFFLFVFFRDAAGCQDEHRPAARSLEESKHKVQCQYGVANSSRHALAERAGDNPGGFCCPCGCTRTRRSPSSGV